MFKSIAIVSAILAASYGSTAVSQTADPVANTAPAAVALVAPIRALGDTDAPVTIDLFASLVCYDCAVWHRDVLPQVKSEFVQTGKARILFHDAMTSPVTQSARAGMYGLCADPAAFYDVVEVFMRGIISIHNGEDGSNFYVDAAAAAGRDREEFERCSTSEDTYNLLILQNEDSRLANFQTFPGVMINGEVVTDLSYENIAAVIAAKLASQ